MAVAITVSLGVGMWLRDITTGYMRIEVMSIDEASATITDITAYVRNGGKDIIYLDRAYVDGVPVAGFTETPLPIDEVTPITITHALGPGTTYEVKIVSKRGTQLEFSVEAK